jgi:anti-anti-sigma regulatory factor
MDTKAISLIVSMYNETREMGAEIHVVGADEEIKDLMHSIQLDEIVLIK